jgi:hypothetical protein
MAKALRPTLTPDVEESTAIDVVDPQEAAEPAQPAIQREEPASAPAAAGATPATMTSPQPEEPKRPSTARSASRPAGKIPNDPSQFASRGEAYAKEMTREVRAQVIADLSGCIGIGCAFNFKRGEVLLLPYWFAVSYPKHIVVKE